MSITYKQIIVPGGEISVSSDHSKEIEGMWKAIDEAGYQITVFVYPNGDFYFNCAGVASKDVKGTKGVKGLEDFIEEIFETLELTYYECLHEELDHHTCMECGEIIEPYVEDYIER